MAILKIFDNLKISVRFTLKQLRCALSSSFDIISDSEKRGILFLQITVMFEMKKKKKKKKWGKKKIGYLNFPQTKRKKTIQQFNDKTSR